MYRSTNDFKVIEIILLDGLEYKIKKLYSDIGNWAYALTVASGELHNANMTQAEKLYKKQFFKASNTTEYKRLYSQGEITKFLNKFTLLGKLKKIFEGTAKILKILKETQKVLEGLKTTIKLFRLGTKMSLPIEQKQGDNKTVEDIQRAMEESVKRFAALMEALRALNTLSPPGFREYFEYGAGIFRGSQRLVKMTKEYTKRLEDAGNKAEKETSATFRRGPTALAGRRAARSHNDVTIFEKLH